MKRILINVTQQEELRIALVDGQHLYGLGIESPGHEQKKANIHKDKIARIEPSLEVALVDHSTERCGFLSLKGTVYEYSPVNCSSHDHPSIKNMLHEGREVIVQIDKKERSNKGAALTTFISLADSYLVLMPNNPHAGDTSHRIKGDDCIKLEEALASLEPPDGMGLIVRTAGVGEPVEALQWDPSLHLKHRETIQKAADSRPAPLLIRQESNVTVRAFRDYSRQDIGEILIDNPKVMGMTRQYITALDRLDFDSKVKLYTGEIPLFSHYQTESQVESAFQHRVCLPSGGLIVIDNTKTLTAIDISSARATRGGDIEGTVFSTDLEAADEIACQLHPCDLGGLIVIDFVDMMPVHHQHVVENRLCKAVHQDRARIQIGHIPRFGLLGMSRQHLSPSPDEFGRHVCLRCSDTGTIRDSESLSPSILRLVEEEVLRENTQEIHVIVPALIASCLFSEKRTVVNTTETRQNGVRCVTMPSNQMETPYYSVLRIHKREEISTLNYLLPKLYKEVMALPTEGKYVECRQPEQPALATFTMPDVPPAPTLQEPVAKTTAPKATAATTTVVAQLGLINRFFGALKSIFGDSGEVRPVEQSAPEAEKKTER